MTRQEPALIIGHERSYKLLYFLSSKRDLQKIAIVMIITSCSYLIKVQNKVLFKVVRSENLYEFNDSRILPVVSAFGFELAG